MAYVRRLRQGPEVGVGGFSESETIYGGATGGKKRRKKPRKVGVGIKAANQSTFTKAINRKGKKKGRGPIKAKNPSVLTKAITSKKRKKKAAIGWDL